MKWKWMLILVVLLLASLACELSGGAKEIPDPDLPPFQSQVGGEMRAFVARGDYVYAGSGPHLIVIDQSDPADPRLVGESTVLPDVIQDIALQDDYAYVAAGEGGLRIIDISDPANPEVTGHLNWDGFAAYIAVNGDTAYVAGNEADTNIKEHGLRIIDVGDKGDPQELSFLETTGYPMFLGFHNDKAYLQQVIDEDDKYAIDITTVDVSNEKSPEIDGSYRITKDAGDVAGYPMTMLDNLAFISNKGKLEIRNMDDASSPDLVGDEELPLQPCGIAVSGERAYAVSQISGLAIIDINDRGNPQVYDNPYPPTGSTNCIIAADGDLAYVDRYKGLELIDVGDPDQPKPSGMYISPVVISGVAVEGDYAYAVSAEAKFHIILISDRLYPDLVGFLEPLQDPSFDVSYPVIIDGDRAYTGSNRNSLVIIDISDKEKPEKEGAFAYASGVLRRAYDILLWADYAYLAAGADGLLVIDLIDLAKPEEAALLPTSNPIRDLALVDNILFAAAGNKGLLSLDIRDPRDPDEIGGLTENLFAGQIFLDGKYAYASGENELFVLDISDRDSPETLATYPLDSSPLAMVLHDGKIYLVDAGRNLITLEIRDHEKFDELSKFKLPCSASDLITDDTSLFIVAQKCGMFLINLADLD